MGNTEKIRFIYDLPIDEGLKEAARVEQIDHQLARKIKNDVPPGLTAEQVNKLVAQLAKPYGIHPDALTETKEVVERATLKKPVNKFQD